MRKRLETESPGQTDARLEHMRTLQQQRLQAEAPEQRDARLEHMSTLQQQRLEVETPEQRDARLEGMRQRLEAETPEQRDARLEHMRTLQQQRLEVETPQEREKMCAPQIDQGYVKGKMNIFHTEMLSIESLLCTTCLEKFPGTKMSVKSLECLRCCRDNKVPKLYSANNNMSPGFVPVELQVSLY